MKKAYRIAENQKDYCCEEYHALIGPDEFCCVLTEPEDRTWYRDGYGVIIELNRLYEENLKLKKRLKGN